MKHKPIPHCVCVFLGSLFANLMEPSDILPSTNVHRSINVQTISMGMHKHYRVTIMQLLKIFLIAGQCFTRIRVYLSVTELKPFTNGLVFS